MFKFLIGALATLMLSACASSVVIKNTIPSPLVERLPLTAHVHYTPEFSNYTYTETKKSRRSEVQSFDFKQAQIGMFDTVFSSLFDIVPAAQQAEIVISPEILDFQYTTPTETKLKVYEVWFKYRIKVDQGDDTERIADWVVKGYGKTPSSTFQSKVKAFNSAADVALRDVGAQLAIKFPNQKSIRNLVYQRRASALPLKPVQAVERSSESQSEAQE